MLRPGTLDDACGDEPSSTCEWIYDQTGENESLTRVLDFLVNRPLQIVLVLLVAWVAARITRRLVRRAVRRYVQAQSSIVGVPLKVLDQHAPEVLRVSFDDPRREARANSIGAVLAGTATALIWTVALIVVADVAGLALGPFLASAGIAGIALGFGAQSLVRDCIAGLFVLIEDQYGIGDVVDLEEAVGTVERFSLRATVVRSVDGTRWHVPNGVFTRVGNRSKAWAMALVDVTVAADADLDRAIALVQQAADQACAEESVRDDVIEPPVVLGVEALTIEGATIRVQAKTQPGRQWSVQRIMRERIATTLVQGGVELARRLLPPGGSTGAET
ncbi:MAG: mechanosensitive ion channel family protein [Ilumatobacteraceae bacterium]|nr:mechanosensitive ion channel family protein [Ilumatobacteraceae bacterium]